MRSKGKDRKGFTATFIGKEEEGEYGAFILRETKQDAEDAKEALLSILWSK